MKICFKCGAEKPLTEYYKHSRMADGHLNKCKDCTKKDSINWRNSKLKECRKYDRKRGSLPHRVKARKEYIGKWKDEDPEGYRKYTYERTVKYREKNRDKYLAHSRLNYHVSNGDIDKKPCMVCGNANTEAHHKDYSKQYDVVWYCDKHHKEEHRRLREEARND